MTRVLIIGYGNPLRRDDGFGWHVAQALTDQGMDPEVQVIGCHQLTPDLAEPVSRAQYAIFVDAAAADTPGKLSTRMLEPNSSAEVPLSHYANAASLLANAQTLYGACPAQTYLVSVTGNDFGYGETLSECVRAVMPIALEQIKARCAKWNH